ncbi:hypothetical protein NE237_002426 [Protea cynaroides]|uniref:Protein ROOT INITIATION DEFECTIVE 3-like n=1 Tax=Protea cynaroides TaxID=273540 RepID=A0A9Q0QZ10_9MAGN|nr:hypothetical protein NE237_002426 [Protea cynaroides]
MAAQTREKAKREERMEEILFTSSADGPIVAYDASSGTTLAHFTGSRCPRKGLSLVSQIQTLTPTENNLSLIAVSHISSSDSASPSIHLYNWWSSTPFHLLFIPEPVAPLLCTPDGSFLFSGGVSGHIHIHAISTLSLIRSFPAHHKPVSCLAFNGDGSLLVSGDDDGAIATFPILRLLDASSAQCDFSLHCFAAHSAAVTSIASVDISTVISCSLDYSCKLWSLTQGTLLHTVRFPCMVWAVAVDQVRAAFYAAGSNGRIYVGPLKSSTHGFELSTCGPEHGHGRVAVTAVTMANEGRDLISAFEDGSIRVWEIDTGRAIRFIGPLEMAGSISDLVVVSSKRIRVKDGCGFVSDSYSRGGQSNRRFCDEEIISRGVGVREMMEMEEMLSVVVTDRKRAIDTLETSLGMYQRLLKLILKEAKGRDSGSTDEPWPCRHGKEEEDGNSL